MAFKMRAGKAGPMHKNFGATPMNSKPSHLKQDVEVELDEQFGYGRPVKVEGGETVDSDPDFSDPNVWSKYYSDMDHISLWPSPSGDPALDRLPGEGVKRSSKHKPAGSWLPADDFHENYPGVKDAGAGYDKYNLGRQTKQEQQDYDRFITDLSKDLSKYRGELPISGDLEMDNESFKNWIKLTGRTWEDPKLRERFEKETTQALNLHNELKLAADAGYKPYANLERLGIDMSQGEYKLNEGKHRVHEENKELRQESLAYRKADNAKAQAENYVKKHGGTVADFLRNRPHLRDDLQGIHSFGQIDVDTQEFFDDAMYADMSKKERKEYDKQKEKEKQEQLQAESEIQANLPGAGYEDEIAEVEAEIESMSDEDPWGLDSEEKEQEEEYVPQSLRKEEEEEVPVDDDDPPVDDPPVDDPGEETFDPADTDVLTTKPTSEIKTEEEIDEYIPQSQRNEITEEEDTSASYVEDDSGEYVPQSQRGMTKNVNYSGTNPFQYGTTPYYNWQKEKRSHVLGLKKRIHNIYGK